MSKLVKLVVTVPEDHADSVRQVLGESGVGKIGNYSFCSFSVKGTGRFKPEVGAQPAIGEVGQLTAVNEERIEVTCDDTLISDIIAAIKAVHPYEEPAIDLYPMLKII